MQAPRHSLKPTDPAGLGGSSFQLPAGDDQPELRVRATPADHLGEETSILVPILPDLGTPHPQVLGERAKFVKLDPKS